MPAALVSEADRQLMISKCVFLRLREKALLSLLHALSNPKWGQALALKGIFVGCVSWPQQLKGSCYYINVNINVSFRGKVRLCSWQIQDERRLVRCSWGFCNFLFGTDASVKNLSAFPFDLISMLAPLIKEQASFAHYQFAFEPQMVRVK